MHIQLTEEGLRKSEQRCAISDRPDMHINARRADRFVMYIGTVYLRPGIPSSLLDSRVEDPLRSDRRHPAGETSG